MKINKFIYSLFFVLLPAYNFASAMKTTVKDPVDIDSANRYLARTINIALTLDAPKEGAWGHTLKAEEFMLIKNAGFTAVRLAIQWITRMDTIAPYKINDEFLARIDWAIAQAEKNHLAIILDNHIDRQLMSDPTAYHDRFLSLWQQLSAHYRHYPPTVLFEVMAEPHGKLDAVWNDYFSEALAIIRQTNPTRPVIVGPRMYNMSYSLSALTLPAQDKYLIVTFHYYNPIQFTMQGETWFPIGKPMDWIGTQWTGTDDEKADIAKTMAYVADWAKKNGRPIFLGEFGAGDRADTASKARYFGFIRQQAEQNNFSWGVFNFTAGFSIYDQATKQWHPGLLHALIPRP